jgi:hypothetical protein
MGYRLNPFTGDLVPFSDAADLGLNDGTNRIGTPGEVGFGVGICPAASVPPGMTPMDGCFVQTSPNYGNYQFRDGSVMVWIPKFFYRIHAWGPTITAATKANPCQLTAAGHGLVTGNKIFVAEVGGMTALNGLVYTVTRVDDDNFTLDGVDSSAYGTFTSGGSFVKGVGAAYEFNRTLATHLRNSVSVVGVETFSTVAAANAMGYALHRAFVDGGVEQLGFFVDKYKCSKRAWGTGFIASSIKDGAPLSSGSAHNPFADLTGGANAYYSAIDLAHRRDGFNGALPAAGSSFFAVSIFIRAALALLSLAHGQASQNDTACAWYHATYNFPKGCNNNALKDANDSAVVYVSDGYSNCGRTGSATAFAKATHNGQLNGVADLNGLMHEVAIGATCIATTKAITGATQANPCVISCAGHGYQAGDVVMITSVVGMTQLNDKLYTVANPGADSFELSGVDSSGYTAYTSGGTLTKGTFYTAKEATAMKDFTKGNTGPTDHWGAAGVAALMEAFTPPFKTASGAVTGACAERMGSGTNQVLSEAVSGAGWKLAGMGFPKDGSGIDPTGVNMLGTDYFYQYVRNEMCLIAGNYWSNGSGAGVWAVFWGSGRSDSYNTVGLRAACYPV